MLSTSP